MDTNEVRAIMAGISTIMYDVDFNKSKWELSMGEVKEAYHLIYKDSLWRLQQKIGQLWFYVREQPIMQFVEVASVGPPGNNPPA